MEFNYFPKNTNYNLLSNSQKEIFDICKEKLCDFVFRVIGEENCKKFDICYGYSEKHTNYLLHIGAGIYKKGTHKICTKNIREISKNRQISFCLTYNLNEGVLSFSLDTCCLCARCGGVKGEQKGHAHIWVLATNERVATRQEIKQIRSEIKEIIKYKLYAIKLSNEKVEIPDDKYGMAFLNQWDINAFNNYDSYQRGIA